MPRMSPIALGVIALMQRNVVIKENKETGASVKELYELRKTAFQQYTDQGL